MTHVKDDRVCRPAVLPRRRAALLGGAAVVLAGWLGPGLPSATAATSHGTGGATLLGTTSSSGTKTEPTVTFPGGTPTPTVSPTTVTATSAATGAVIALDSNSFTIQTRGSAAGTINAMTTYATALGAANFPYVWGGGHAQAQIASVGEKGPGHDGKRTGFDCSGAVAAVLAAGGLWPKGEGVPNDAGVIQSLLSRGLIAKGPGTGPYEVTLYDNPGVHIFMNIDGRFFGTSDGSGGGDAAGGPGWLSDGAYDALNPKVFKRYHLLPAALSDSDSYAHQITFQYAGGVAGAEVVSGLSLDANVRVAYAQASDGALDMSTVGFVGSSTVSGTVSSVVATGSQFSLRTSSGRTLTLSVPDTSLTAGLLAGETITATYTRQSVAKGGPAELVVHTLSVVTTPSGSTTTTTPTPTPTAPARTTPVTSTTSTSSTTPTTPTPSSTSSTTTPTPTTTVATGPPATTAAGSGVSALFSANATGGKGF
jgi:hypothetical protein